MKRKNPYAKPDAFTQRAKSAGYPARSIYKLEEIDRRARLLKGGMHVLDLGAAPGSWSLYAAQKYHGKLPSSLDLFTVKSVTVEDGSGNVYLTAGF